MGMPILLSTRTPYKIRYQDMSSRPERSEVEGGGDLLFSIPASNPDGSTTLPFVIPSEAEGSAVPSTSIESPWKRHPFIGITTSLGHSHAIRI